MTSTPHRNNRKSRYAAKPETVAALRTELLRLGMTESFSEEIMSLLGTEYTASRMLKYLIQEKPTDPTVVTDEAVAIREQRDGWVQDAVFSRHTGSPARRMLERIQIEWSDELRTSYVAGIPALKGLRELDFTSNVTMFSGENGAGKSTLLEAIAVACKLNPEGGTENFDFSTYDDVSPLAKCMLAVWGVRRPKRKFFLRAESFFNVATMYLTKYGVGRPFEPPPPDYHAQSHGESFLHFFERVEPDGFYLLDEPEAALSPMRQLTLLRRLVDMADLGAQFILCTHSPILLAAPGATILSFDTEGIRPIEYEQTESYRIYRAFLSNRFAMLRKLLLA